MKDKVDFKIYDVSAWETNNCNYNTHTAQCLKNYWKISKLHGIIAQCQVSMELFPKEQIFEMNKRICEV